MTIFSKRRRCGPKARTVEEKEKRARTGPSDDSGGEGPGPNTPQAGNRGDLSPLGYTGSSSGLEIPGSEQALQIASSTFPLLAGVPQRPTPGFTAPLTMDGLSGLVGLIAPTLSDSGGSGTSVGSEEPIASYRPVSPNILQQDQQQQLPLGRVSTFHVGNSPSRASMPQASPNVTPMDQQAPLDHANTSQGTAAMAHQERASTHGSTASWPFMSSNGGTGISSTVSIPAAPKLPVDVLRSTLGMCDTTRSVPTFVAPTPVFHRQDAGRDWIAAESLTRGPQSVAFRGPLLIDPMPAAARAHLSTFLKSVGSLLPLPGIEALRDAVVRWEAAGCGGKETSDLHTEAGMIQGLGGPGGGSRARHSRGETFGDEMDEMDEDGGDDVQGNDLDQRQQMDHVSQLSKASDPRRRGSDVVMELGIDAAEIQSEFDGACRAEAWACVAMGALFSGVPEDEAASYSACSLKALSSCFDAALPEVSAG